MANGSTTLARIQGQGLVETAPTGTAEMASAGFSPAGALQKGLSPDSAKMAGTPPAKTNAIRMAIQDVGSRRLGALREMAQPELQADTRTTGVMRHASVIGRLDETMSAYINTQLTAAFNESILKAGNTNAKLKSTVFSGDKGKQEALTNAVANINSGKGTDADIKIINEALASINTKDRVSLTDDTGATTNATIIANNLFENLTPEQMKKAFANAVAKANESTSVGSFLSSAGKEADTFAKNEGLAGVDELNELVLALLPKDKDGKPIGDLNTMTLSDLTTAIQTWRQENFKDVAEYQKTLADPSASDAQRQLALENLRRLGKVGVIALDAKVGDLDAQMRDGDTINIDGQQFDIASFFTDPEKLAELQGWLDKPDTAPASLRPWLEGNRDAIQNTAKNLSPELQKLSDTVKENQKAVELPQNVQLDSGISEYFFDDLTKPTLAAKTVPEKYKLLQDPTTGAGMVTLLNRLKTVSQHGLDGRKIFDNLSVDELRTIITTNGVERYLENIVAQKYATDFSSQSIDANSFGSSFKILMQNMNMGNSDAATSLPRFFNRPLNEFLDIFQEAGLGDLLVNMGNSSSPIAGLSLEKIREKIKEFSNAKPGGLISGDAKTEIENYLNGIVNKIRKAAGTPKLKTIPTSTTEKDELFRKEKNVKSPKMILAEKEAERNKIGGENHQNFLNVNQSRKELNLLRFSADGKKYFDKYGNLVSPPIQAWNELPSQFQARLAAYNKVKQVVDKYDSDTRKFNDSAARFTNVDNDWNTYRDNMPQHELDYRDQFDAWFDTYQANLTKDNEKIQARYTKLSNILGGLD